MTVTLTETTVTLRPLALVFEVEHRVGPCPICRLPTSTAGLGREPRHSPLPKGF